MQVHPTVLPVTVQALVPKLSGLKAIGNFYLSGGSALALQLGHRESEDLDFFSEADFNPQFLQQDLVRLGKLQDTEISEGTLNTYINGVKLQFLHYPYPLLDKTILWEGIALSAIIDIACTKLITISMRGGKKDFIDLYFILKQFSLEKLFQKLEDKYKQVDYEKVLILKSLVYFADAETQPMPRMLLPLNWGEVKLEIISQVKAYKT